jgi:hypothetical protein
MTPCERDTYFTCTFKSFKIKHKLYDTRRRGGAHHKYYDTARSVSVNRNRRESSREEGHGWMGRRTATTNASMIGDRRLIVPLFSELEMRRN